MSEVIDPRINITTVDTQHEMKVMIVVDVSAMGRLRNFRVEGKGTSTLEIYENGIGFPIRVSDEISNTYTDVEYNRNGFVSIFIRACYKNADPCP